MNYKCVSSHCDVLLLVSREGSVIGEESFLTMGLLVVRLEIELFIFVLAFEDEVDVDAMVVVLLLLLPMRGM